MRGNEIENEPGYVSSSDHEWSIILWMVNLLSFIYWSTHIYAFGLNLIVFHEIRHWVGSWTHTPSSVNMPTTLTIVYLCMSFAPRGWDHEWTVATRRVSLPLSYQPLYRFVLAIMGAGRVEREVVLIRPLPNTPWPHLSLSTMPFLLANDRISASLVSIFEASYFLPFTACFLHIHLSSPSTILYYFFSEWHRIPSIHHSMDPMMNSRLSVGILQAISR